MNCATHPERAASDRCAGCAEPFCPNCLVEVQGRKYCAQCKVLAVQGKAPALAPTATCKEAKEALQFAIVGLFCFGIILEPIAISKALKARKIIAEDPSLGGSGMATAALVIAVIGLGLWILGIFARVSQGR